MKPILISSVLGVKGEKMRLIDADELYDLLDGGYDIDLDELPETKAELLRMIDDQETVDAVPVVRCKDCKWWNDEYCVDFMTTDRNGFCAWGERREDG